MPVITRELGLNIYRYLQQCRWLICNNTIDKNIRDLKIKLGIDNIPIKNN